MRRLLLAVLLALPLWGGNGEIVENVASRADPSQTYSLYLPRSHDTPTRRPLLLVFDPRGRGTHAASIFRDGAERHGWIVLSANGTRSDEEGEGNARAVAALLTEADRYQADPRRIYTAGFSGTAMLAAAVAVNTRSIAGVIGVGGRQIPQLSPREFGFAHFGAAGRFDFNNREMRAIDDALADAGRDHRFVEFEGEHEWFDGKLAEDAIRWMELVAMRKGLRLRDAAFVDASWDGDLSLVERLIGDGEIPAAMRILDSMVRTYDGLRPTGEARDRIDQLSPDERSAAARADEQKWDAFEARYQREVFEPVWRLLAAVKPPPRPAAVSGVFRTADLQRRARRPGAEGRAARRLLEAVYAQTSFYLPRALTARGEHALAAALLHVATELHPDRWSVRYELARAEARSGNRKGALSALAAAVDRGFADRARLLTDDAFTALREDGKFRAIAGRLP